MSCPSVEEFEWYANGIANGETRLRIDLHLPDCPECPQRLAEVRRHLALAAKVAAWRPPPAAAQAARGATAGAAAQAIPRGRRIAVSALIVSALIGFSGVLSFAVLWRRTAAREAQARAAAQLAEEISLSLAGILTAAEHGVPEAATPLREALGPAYAALGLSDRAEQHFEAALRLRQGLDQPDQLAVARVATDLAWAVFERGDFVRAASLAEPALPALSRGELARARCLNLLSVLSLERSQREYAEHLAREALEACGAAPPGPARDRAEVSILASLVHALRDQQKYDQAAEAAAQALKRAREVYGDEHPLVATQLHALGAVLQAQERFDEAETLHREALALRRRLLGDDDPRCAPSLWHLAQWRLAQWRRSPAEGERHLVDAERLLREGLRLYEDAKTPHWFAQVTRVELGAVLRDQRRFADAQQFLVAGCRALLQNPGVPRARQTWAVEHVIALYAGWHAAEPGRGHDARADEWRAKLDTLP